jgi:UDP-N-acetyl-D-mannosaminuronic acid transferase (WecB/TagA/CpsF family)
MGNSVRGGNGHWRCPGLRCRQVQEGAPVWMQDHGFEWLFRLCVDFRWLWRRYLIQDMPFIPLVFLQRLRTR